MAMPAERCEPPDPSVRCSAKPSDLDTSNIASHGMAVSSVSDINLLSHGRCVRVRNKLPSHSMRRPTKWLSMPKIYRPDLHKSISCFGWMVYLAHCPYSLVGKCWRHAVHQTSAIARAEAPQRCQHTNAIVHCVIRPVANIWDLQAEGSERIHETIVGESSASATSSRSVLGSYLIYIYTNTRAEDSFDSVKAAYIFYLCSSSQVTGIRPHQLGAASLRRC